MSEKDQQKAAAVETAATGDRGGLSQAELDELVASSDTGGRAVSGLMGTLLLLVALAWSLFQLYIASPIGLFNDTLARSIHLGFAVFLGIMVFPATRTSFQVALGVIVPAVLAALFMVSTKDSTAIWWIPIPALFVIATVLLGSPKNRVPIWEWALAIVGTFCALYLFIFYREIANRVGAPILPDYIAGVTGLLILLEATRRALGPALMIVASIFLFYTVLGPSMPSIIAHKGNSLSEIVNHQWITTEGVFGIALGVSTSFVFLFVLFGSLLDRAGAGNYFIQVAFSLMGHMRGGPAKAAVVASAMTGLISGSSIANVVTTGTFTIPLMKKVGFNSEKAGAVEVASSVNGQIMPPVMGAAAFLMVEYVGIPYFDVVKHAFLPAVISYIALVYIVHLEAMKAGMQGLPRAYTPKPLVQQLIGIAFAIIAICALSFAVYYLMGWIRPAFPETAGYIIFVFLTAVYVGLLYVASKEEPLKLDDPNAEVTSLPMPGPTARSGLHFILPVVVLVWALMVDRLSPGLSAFWAAAYMIFILLTQRPLMAMFRGESQFVNDVKAGVLDLIDGLVTGARNMIGIGIATATAGIIVGAVSQTGVGSALADVVEVLSGGNILAILFLTAVLSLILGMGLPTTANYIVVSALLAPVIVTLGQQNGLIVPLIAVHLFVFYFGIMADVTPPVGLASFAAAAVSGGDPIRTGLVAFFYSLRTAALPFLFIFNTELLLIGVTWGQGLFIFVVATVAMLLFAAATQGWFLARNRFYETIALLLIAFTLFRPGFWMDMVYPPYSEEAPTEIVQAAEETPAGERLRLRVAGVNDLGDPLEFVALLPIGAGETGAEKLEAAGLMFREDGDKMIIDDVLYDSPAQGAGLDWDQEVLRVLKPMPQPSKYWMFIPALLLLALVVFLQRGRAARDTRKPATA
ncbi:MULTISPECIES: TRAP transporter permease [Sulfitobacter]|jgi:TRAP transporter 4TM/12TM fusion protein|uniref:TRAP transporter permease n=2 Tax=Alphaproteobacteria TaxID=28211 RepID=A0ABW1YWU6_9RHOB|nr:MULTISPECIES: TRAP transporter permease [Sulfitobacter]AYE84791.1 C4-dicarboxylate ABC transporter [Sulfitobacter sp. D7]KZX92000.1 C4-dicarboxylate ABC transporter [Sulfitobacter sp. HI0021]KZX96429.1 C4-dicarboxylate ABC transporter [Sulfitobacter sp. HI0027]KZZ02721.1 C4-dicarboxylate ABC transporter [Sulfitobacter sp. HI0076]UWR37614.1 TRAP transporter permease [Sulfitobacter sp. W074]